MSLKCGIIGLPNIGKSSLFNALTQGSIPAENYPFCTIEPNSGVVQVPDRRLDELDNLINPKAKVEAIMEFTDIAGLVKGASHGQGLGNQFLSHIREMDALIHVVRAFEDDDIIHVSEKVSPQDDIIVVETELALADLEQCVRSIEKIKKKSKGSPKESATKLSILDELCGYLSDGKMLRNVSLSKETNQVVQDLQFLTAKPTIFLANVDEDSLKGNSFSDLVQDFALSNNSNYVILSAALELELAGLPESEKDQFLQMLGLEETGLTKLIRSSFDLLKLHCFFSAGKKEVRAWSIKHGATAYEAAKVIHSDIQRGFIKADVVSYDDYIEFSGESGARENGKLRTEGKEYVVQDGDIINFKFNV